MTIAPKIDAAGAIPLAAQAISRHFPVRASAPFLVETNDDGSGLRLIGREGFEAEAELALTADGKTGRLVIARPDGSHPADADSIAALIEAAFQSRPALSRLELPGFAGKPAIVGLTIETGGTEGATCAVIARSVFYQLPLLWRLAGQHAAYPALRSRLGPADRQPPLRPAQPNGEIYRRWLPHLGMTLSLRTIDRRRDLDLFHHWMNQPRVAFFWELAQSREELDRYLAEQEADPHLFGVIGSLDEEPVGYFEFYWAKEDRLGPHYESEDFDRGWHGLIGNPRHLGRAKTLAWFRSLTHYLFLDEPRTRRIVGEPRASHHKMLSYCADVAYEKVKEFDFPHKRAALVCCERERFFREIAL
jgi:hypothetical protein